MKKIPRLAFLKHDGDFQSNTSNVLISFVEVVGMSEAGICNLPKFRIAERFLGPKDRMALY